LVINRCNDTAAKTQSEGVDLSEKFVLRLLLISVAKTYLVVALKILDEFWPDKKLVG